jgi:hypothetical protein
VQVEFFLLHGDKAEGFSAFVASHLFIGGASHNQINLDSYHSLMTDM